MTTLNLTEEDARLLMFILERERKVPNLEEQVILMTIEAVTDAIAPHRGPNETVHGAVRRLLGERSNLLTELDRLTKLVNETPVVPELSREINWLTERALAVFEYGWTNGSASAPPLVRMREVVRFVLRNRG